MGRSMGTVASETDAAETFKMHAPLIGNRTDCAREKGNKRSSSPCMGGWGVGSAQLPKAQDPAGRPGRME